MRHQIRTNAIIYILLLFVLPILSGCSSSGANQTNRTINQPTAQQSSPIQKSTPTKKPDSSQQALSEPTSTRESATTEIGISNDREELIPVSLSRSTPPNNILEEIYYYPGGGDPGECKSRCVIISNDTIVLSHFRSNQTINIFVYNPIEYSEAINGYITGKGSFIVEWNITTDDEGSARLTPEGGDPNHFDYILFDGNTGQVLTMIENNYESPYKQESSCPGAPPQRVRVNTPASVCTKNDRLILREEPRRVGPEVNRINPGTVFVIREGPVCADNWTWWKIETDEGVNGWVSEGGDSIDPYFICPLE